MINIVNGAKYNAKLSSQRALKLNKEKNKSSLDNSDVALGEFLVFKNSKL